MYGVYRFIISLWFYQVLTLNYTYLETVFKRLGTPLQWGGGDNTRNLDLDWPQLRSTCIRELLLLLSFFILIELSVGLLADY